MKVSELLTMTRDKVVIYKDVEDYYIDIFCGLPEDIPDRLLQLELFAFGSRSKGVLDIQVKI